MTQSENKVFIEGLLMEADVNTGSTADGRGYIKANLTVRVEQDINGKKEVCDIPVQMFSMQHNKRVSATDPLVESKIYDGIKRITSDYISYASCGADKTLASRIRLTGALEERIFVSRTGTTISDPFISARFVSASKADSKDAATFTTVAVLAHDGVLSTEVNDVMSHNVTGYVVQYNDKLDCLKFKVELPEAIDYINNNWKKGETLQINGKLRFTQTTKTTSQEVDFGDPIEKSYTVFQKDILITSGSKAGFDDTRAYSEEDIAAAVKARMGRVEEEIAKSKERSTAKPAVAATPATTQKDALGF